MRCPTRPAGTCAGRATSGPTVARKPLREAKWGKGAACLLLSTAPIGLGCGLPAPTSLSRRRAWLRGLGPVRRSLLSGRGSCSLLSRRGRRRSGSGLGRRGQDRYRLGRCALCAPLCLARGWSGCPFLGCLGLPLQVYSGPVRRFASFRRCRFRAMCLRAGRRCCRLVVLGIHDGLCQSQQQRQAQGCQQTAPEPLVRGTSGTHALGFHRPLAATLPERTRAQDREPARRQSRYPPHGLPRRLAASSGRGPRGSSLCAVP